MKLTFPQLKLIPRFSVTLFIASLFSIEALCRPWSNASLKFRFSHLILNYLYHVLLINFQGYVSA